MESTERTAVLKIKADWQLIPGWRRYCSSIALWIYLRFIGGKLVGAGLDAEEARQVRARRQWKMARTTKIP